MNALGSRTAAQSSYLLDVARAKSWGVKVKHALPAAMRYSTPSRKWKVWSPALLIYWVHRKKKIKKGKSRKT